MLWLCLWNSDFYFFWDTVLHLLSFIIFYLQPQKAWQEKKSAAKHQGAAAMRQMHAATRRQPRATPHHSELGAPSTWGGGEHRRWRTGDNLGSFTTISTSPTFTLSHVPIQIHHSLLQMPLITQLNCATVLKVQTLPTMPCKKDTTAYFLQLPL